MKQAILLFISATLSTFAFGQRQAIRAPHNITPTTAARSMAVGDTLSLTNISPSDTLTLYNYGAGHGYVAGTNTYGDAGFAESYTINGNDSSLTVIGVMSRFGGHVSPVSTQSVSFTVWGITSQVAVTGSLAYDYFPINGQDTVVVPVNHLGVGGADTMKAFFFPHPTDTIQGAFFIGYTTNYNFTTLTDTFGLYSSVNGARTAPWYTVNVIEGEFDTTSDTIVHVQNATLWSDNTWHENYTQNDSLKNDLAIFPIVTIGQPTGINSVTRNNLTFFGNYPNPANDYTNVKYSLAKNADVTLQLMDMQGRVINTTFLKAQSTGEHIINLPTNNLAPGNYLYSIITSSGDAIASKMSVIR